MVLGAGAVAIAAAAGSRGPTPTSSGFRCAVAVSVMAAFLHQVFRARRPATPDRGGRPPRRRVGGDGVGAAFIPLPYYPHGGSWALVAVLGVAAASLPALLLGGRLSPAWVLLAALVLGTGASVVAAGLATGIALGGAALVGVLAAGISHSTMRVLFALPGAMTTQGAVAVGAAGVLVVGVVVYVLAGSSRASGLGPSELVVMWARGLALSRRGPACPR